MVPERIRRLDRAGYTLPELLVVMAVIAILTTIGVPYLNSFYNSMKLRSGADELATVLNSGRYLAIKQNTNVCVIMSGTVLQYWTGTNGACGGGALYIGQGTRSDGNIPLQNTMDVSASTSSVVFTNLGAARQGGTYTVRNPIDGHTLTVTVSGSGRITIP